ncbi:hypothetical protein [Eisenbergiella tayi]|uniref:hypothetical protein n=1 Tax=Eisenbergiella tayi TaxID=1432052 RepID=UPI0004ACCE31|nr:hypothetical protein [Eisenbergiella tayi]
MNAVSGSVRRITISAVFLSLSLVLKTTLTFDLPYSGRMVCGLGFQAFFPSFRPFFSGRVTERQFPVFLIFLGFS